LYVELKNSITDVFRVLHEEPPAPAGIFTIPFSLSEVSEVEHFVARGEELAEIHKVLRDGSGRRTVVVHGLGGMGKTQLAAEYATRHRNDYSAVFWLNARDETSLKQSFARVAERILRNYPSVAYMKNAVESRDLDEAVQAVKRWLDEAKNGGWLIICDNYDNPRVEEDEKAKQVKGSDGGKEDKSDAVATEAYSIKAFLPETHHGAVLITTRSARVMGKKIALSKLRNVADSLEILSHTSGRDNLHDGM
jgi:hypothetical protein